MRLGDVVRNADLEPIDPIPDHHRQIEIIDVTHDSRLVSPGALFAAVVGATHDGHDHAPAAVGNGASALLVEQPLGLGVPNVVVSDVRRDMGRAAAAVWGRPDAAMTTVGVTGTAGKTTTTYLIAGVMRAAGHNPEVVGTIGNELTTPESTDLHRSLAHALAAGRDAVAMEVSSHALTLHRVEPVTFDIAVFTNLGTDHLDFHSDLDDYYQAKRRLFGLDRAMRGLVCSDDEAGRRLLNDPDPTLVERRPYSIAEAEDLQLSPTRSRFTWRGYQIDLHIPGRFNVANAIAALHVADQLGYDIADAAAGLASVERIKGRFEAVNVDGAEVAVVVDYSHKPDALIAMLAAARELGRGRLIVVFGAGGDRDRVKRPQMGRAAVRGADRVIITSDNPRHEDPGAIIEDILRGCEDDGSVTVEPDRASAIALAIAQAAPGDLVVIAGKGHETTQTVGDQKFPFDDVAHAHRALERRAATGQGRPQVGNE